MVLCDQSIKNSFTITHVSDYIVLRPVFIPNRTFWYASAAYQASLVEPWFVFWGDTVEPKYPWRDQTSLKCRRSVPKKV